MSAALSLPGLRPVVYKRHNRPQNTDLSRVPTLPNVIRQWQMSWCPGAAHRSATNEWMGFCTLDALACPTCTTPKLCSALVAHPAAGRCSFQLLQTNPQGNPPLAWAVAGGPPSLLATAAGGRGLQAQQATGQAGRDCQLGALTWTMWAAGC